MTAAGIFTLGALVLIATCAAYYFVELHDGRGDDDDTPDVPPLF